MNLYKIEQDLIDDYDTYDSAVVVAESEDEARKIHPSPFVTHHDGERWMGTYAENALNGMAGQPYSQEQSYPDWPNFRDIEHVSVTYLGEADDLLKAGTVICSSFNAG